MKRLFLRLGGTIAAVLFAIALVFFAARAGWLTPDDPTLRMRYALPESKYTDIDGETVHYADQGSGPAVVLVHGSFGSLRMWNAWAAKLTGKYRVIRFDRPRQGLSGPAPAGRTGTEQEMRIIAALTQQLGVDRFFLVATSSAGASGAAYAADHPEQVRGLLLANIAVGAFNPAAGERTRVFRLLASIDPWLKGYKPREFWRQVLLMNFHEPAKVTGEIAQEWSDLNNRAQRMPPATFKGSPMADFAKTVDDLKRMTVPTLLLWSDHDHELPLETMGRRGLELLGSADKKLKVISDCGHMMPLECGAASAPSAVAFFDRLVATGG